MVRGAGGGGGGGSEGLLTGGGGFKSFDPVSELGFVVTISIARVVASC